MEWKMGHTTTATEVCRLCCQWSSSITVNRFCTKLLIGWLTKECCGTHLIAGNHSTTTGKRLAGANCSSATDETKPNRIRMWELLWRTTTSQVFVSCFRTMPHLEAFSPHIHPPRPQVLCKPISLLFEFLLRRLLLAARATTPQIPTTVAGVDEGGKWNQRGPLQIWATVCRMEIPHYNLVYIKWITCFSFVESRTLRLFPFNWKGPIVNSRWPDLQTYILGRKQRQQLPCYSFVLRSVCLSVCLNRDS